MRLTFKGQDGTSYEVRFDAPTELVEYSEVQVNGWRFYGHGKEPKFCELNDEITFLKKIIKKLMGEG